MNKDLILLLVFAIIVGLREVFNHTRIKKVERALDERTRELTEERTSNAAKKSDEAGRSYYDALDKYRPGSGPSGNA